MIGRLNKQVLRLDITMAVAESVDIGEGAEGLVCIELDQDYRHLLLHLVVVLEDAIDSFWHIVHHNIQIDLILLVTLSVERMLQLNDIGVRQLLHDLQFTILVALVLVNLLDSDLLTVRALSRRLENDAKGAIADHSVRIVCTVHLVLK